MAIIWLFVGYMYINIFGYIHICIAQLVKNPPAMRWDLGSISGLGRSLYVCVCVCVCVCVYTHSHLLLHNPCALGKKEYVSEFRNYSFYTIITTTSILLAKNSDRKFKKFLGPHGQESKERLIVASPTCITCFCNTANSNCIWIKIL